MGQKVNPIGFRLGINRTWDSRWFARKDEYGKLLHQDIAIRRELKQRGERVGTATVYRTLDLLVESGLVRAHDFGEGFKRYEPMAAQADHEHLICQRCGRVVEFANERLERMLPILADEHGFQHQRHRLEIYGVCRECRQRELGPL